MIYHIKRKDNDSECIVKVIDDKYRVIWKPPHQNCIYWGYGDFKGFETLTYLFEIRELTIEEKARLI
jgi:hypothetical protein